MKSKYAGNFQIWVEFLHNWMARRGVFLSSKKDFKSDEYISNFPIQAPNSYVHFCAAMESFGWPQIIKCYGEDDLFFKLINPSEVQLLAYHDKYYFESLSKLDKPLPILFQNEKYKNYSRTQDELVPFNFFIASYVIGNQYDAAYRNHLLINPLVRTNDGEWEAIYQDTKSPFSARFMSFADLIVWLFISESNIQSSDFDWSWYNHEYDLSGDAKKLFSD